MEEYDKPEKTKPDRPGEQIETKHVPGKAAEARIQGTDYTTAAAKGAAEHPDHAIKAQGRAGEQVALQEIKNQQGQAVDLNDGGAANFPIYDVAGPKSVASVKVRGLEDGDKLSEATKKQYIRDLEEATGHGSGRVEPTSGQADSDWSQAKFNNAARYLHDRAKNGDPLPAEIGKSQADAANYLRGRAELKIPQDHATQVHDFLREQLFSPDAIQREVQASRLGLDIHSAQYQAEAEKMINRVKGLPITSAQLRATLA